MGPSQVCRCYRRATANLVLTWGAVCRARDEPLFVFNTKILLRRALLTRSTMHDDHPRRHPRYNADKRLPALSPLSLIISGNVIALLVLWELDVASGGDYSGTITPEHPSTTTIPQPWLQPAAFSMLRSTKPSIDAGKRRKPACSTSPSHLGRREDSRRDHHAFPQ
jgi:hypothetical protein